MQMARLATTAMAGAAVSAARAARAFADFERAYQCVEALGKEFIDLRHHTG